MIDKLRDMLISLVQEQGATLYADPAHCRDALRLLFSGRQREIEELVVALECGITGVLLNNSATPLRRLVDAMEMLAHNPQFKYGDASVSWAAESWALALKVITAADVERYAAMSLAELKKLPEYEESSQVIKITAQDSTSKQNPAKAWGHDSEPVAQKPSQGYKSWWVKNWKYGALAVLALLALSVTLVIGSKIVAHFRSQTQPTDGISAKSDSLQATPVPPGSSNQRPIAKADVYSGEQNRALEIDRSHGLLSNDSDPDNNELKTVMVTPPVNGRLSAFGPDGSFTYEPNSGFTGKDQFGYKVNDGEFDSDIATVQLDIQSSERPSVTSSNQAPLAQADAYAGMKNTPLVIEPGRGLLRNDSDPDHHDLAAILATPPNNGQLKAFEADGSFIYEPGPDFVGKDQFSYKVNDGELDSEIATVRIQIQPGKATVTGEINMPMRVGFGNIGSLIGAAQIIGARSLLNIPVEIKLEKAVTEDGHDLTRYLAFSPVDLGPSEQRSDCPINMNPIPIGTGLLSGNSYKGMLTFKIKNEKEDYEVRREVAFSFVYTN